MTRTTFARISLALAMTAAPVAFLAAPAAADGPHPAPLCGALNMIEASPSFYQDKAGVRRHGYSDGQPLR
jgi:hypothetical protein